MSDKLTEEADRHAAERDRLISAIKQHRNATESRLRLLDSRAEAAKSMLKADRDLYDVLDSVCAREEAGE